MKEIQKNRITIISRNQYQRADIETQSKQFYFQDNHIHYENKLEIVENTMPKINGVNVVNNLCTLKDNKLIKTTVVYFEDKLIRIEDEFYLQNYSNNIKVETQSSSIKKSIPNFIQPQFIPLNSNSELYSSSISQIFRKKKDLKNIVKNIVKIFIHWLEYSSAEGQECKSIMESLLQSHKYNNSLVKAMSSNPITNRIFLSFLLTEAQDSISQSRIHDKKTHLDTLKKYQSIFEKGQYGYKATSINGSCFGGSSEYKAQSNQNKYKGQSDNNNTQKIQYQDIMNEQNENKGSSKSSQSDKFFNKSNSNNSNENRNRSMMSSSNPDNYISGERINSRDNMIFFSSSGSDQ